MTEQTSDSLLALFDRAPLNPRYWRSFAIIAAGSMLDLFDFFIVGYLVAELGPRWHLTYGQSAIILLSGGIGAIISAPIWGPPPCTTTGSIPTARMRTTSSANEASASPGPSAPSLSAPAAACSALPPYLTTTIFSQKRRM